MGNQFTGKPGIPDVTIEGDTAKLNWTKPRDDGKSPIFNYNIEYKQSGDLHWKLANEGFRVKDTNYVMSGLEPDKEFEFRVSAENKAGVGAPSGSSKTVKYGEGKTLFIENLHNSMAWHNTSELIAPVY